MILYTHMIYTIKTFYNNKSHIVLYFGNPKFKLAPVLKMLDEEKNKRHLNKDGPGESAHTEAYWSAEVLGQIDTKYRGAVLDPLPELAL